MVSDLYSDNAISGRAQTLGKDGYPMRKRMRWKDFDYSSQGAYFITIVTKDRRNLFGDIYDGNIHNNAAGRMIREKFERLEERYSDIGCLDSVVMPNHFHCIMYIDKDGGTLLTEVIKTFKSITSVRYIQGVKQDNWQPFDKQLWQTSYWDDIIWNGRQFEFIKNYIYLNPSRWDRDNINMNHINEVDHVLQHIKALR